MPLPRLRPRLQQGPTSRIVVLLRGPAAALVMALLVAGLVAGCGGVADDLQAGEETTKTDEADAEPGNETPAPEPGYEIPKLGQCYRMTPAQSRASVSTSRPVDCKSEHNAVVAYVGYVPRAVTPETPVGRRRILGKRVCEPAYQRVVGGTLADRASSILTWTMFTPGQDQLERGARWIRCDVIARSGDQLIALPDLQPLLAQGIPEQLRICQSQVGVDISCGVPYAFRVVAVYQAVGQAYPDPARYTPIARLRCKELMGVFGGFWQPPSVAGWEAGDRFIRCLSPKVVPPDPTVED